MASGLGKLAKVNSHQNDIKAVDIFYSDPPVQGDNVAEPLVCQFMGNQVENPEPESGTLH